MTIDFNLYRDKVRACWLGKNIGGTLGAPFEGVRGFVPVQYYTHDLSKGVLPNDDLDLQLVWLGAAQLYGRALTADILAEYWLNYIVGDWAEYGAAKNNLKAGLPVGIANRIGNLHKDSNGCFIRSEIWACLAPGRPEIAVKYAYEDGIIDHADEGLWGEIFCAAVQSAAFAESDLFKLIEIGLSYIPESSVMASGIKTAIKCYESRLSFPDAYKKVMQEVPGSFGLNTGKYIGAPDPDIPVAPWGFDAPNNVALTVLSLLYSEGDFSKAVCYAASCCEDADCTAGTAGSIIGIIGGTKCIDEKWLVPIGDEIKTVSVDRTKRLPENTYMPNTVSELTDRIVRLMPTFMQNFYDPASSVIETAEDLYDTRRRPAYHYARTMCETFTLRNRGVKKENCLFEAVVVPVDGFDIHEGEEKILEFHFDSKLCHHQWLTIQVDFPDAWECSTRETGVTIYENYGHSMFAKKDIRFIPRGLSKGRYDIPITLGSQGRQEEIHMKLVFFVN